MAKHYSAGGVVVGTNNKIVVVSQNGDSWSLPKGHLDPGEGAREAAEREIYEESGVSQLDFLCELGSYERPRIGKGGVGDSEDDTKHLTFFLYKTNQSDLSPVDPENPEAVWLNINEVAGKLTHSKDVEFFAKITPIIKRHLDTQA